MTLLPDLVAEVFYDSPQGLVFCANSRAVRQADYLLPVVSRFSQIFPACWRRFDAIMDTRCTASGRHRLNYSDPGLAVALLCPGFRRHRACKDRKSTRL